MLKLTENFYIDATDNDFSIVEWDGSDKYDKKQGKFVKTHYREWTFTHFETMVQALQILLVRRGIARSKDMDEMRESFKETQEIIRAVCQSIDPREARKA